MSDISKIKVSGVEYDIKDIQAREDLGNLGTRVSAIEGKEAGWNSKYSKPTNGIPKTDLAQAVQTSLSKADSALQSVPSTYRTASEQDIIDNGKVDKVTGKGLSSNDYTDAAKAKVDALAPVATSGSYNDLTNKPKIPSIPKPLTYDYMPAGYPSKSVQTTTLMEEQAVAFASEDGGVYGASLSTAFEIVEGQTYTVTWDSADYECVCSVYYSTILSLGNKSIYGAGNDTGEPFLYISTGTIATLETTASHTISVKRIEETVTPIDKKYLPESAFTVADWDLVSNRPFFYKPLNVNITAENITETINLGSNYIDLGATVPDFNEGLYYKVEGEVAFLNNSADVSYPLQINGYYKANSQAEISLGTVYDGYSKANLDVSLYGNNSAVYRWKLRVYTAHAYTNSYTITANLTIISEVKQLSEDYIPNTIQRVGDDVIIPSSTEGSTKKFKITVNDAGTLSATEVTA